MDSKINNLRFEESYESITESGKLELEANRHPEYPEYLEIIKPLLSVSIYRFLSNNLEEICEIIRTTKLSKQDSISVMTYKKTLSIIREQEWFEPPQFIWMRVAAQLYAPDIAKVKICYKDYMAGYYVPSTPCIINAGLKKPMLSSCFLEEMDDDLEDIFNCVKSSSLVQAKNAAEGINLSRIRHSSRSDGGKTNGVIPIVSMLNSTSSYISNERKPTIQVSLNIWHLDVLNFCKINSAFCSSSLSMPHVNICLWTCNLFWDRVRNLKNWTLFCPKAVPRLFSTYGEEFERIYLEAENDPSIPEDMRMTIDANRFYKETILKALKENGQPFIMNRDACTLKSNHRHLGSVTTNLCVEIIQNAEKDFPAVCNLHSLSLRKFVKNEKFNFELLGKKTRYAVCNLNRMMETAWYPYDNSNKRFRNGNNRHLAIALGVSGFAEMLYKMKLSFVSEETRILNKKIFACIYFNALCESALLSKDFGSYPTYEGSPISEGKFQFDLWKEEYLQRPTNLRRLEDFEPIDPQSWGQTNISTIEPSWDSLRKFISRFGIRNSLVTALMPTDTSSRICRNSQSVEPPLAGIFSHKSSIGATTVVNRFLEKDLKELGFWNQEIVNFLIVENGSLKNLDKFVSSCYQISDEISEKISILQKRYQTAQEISQKKLLMLMADRCMYIDQSSSNNVFIGHDKETPFETRMLAYHLCAQSLGLKTMNYYCRVGRVQTEDTSKMVAKKKEKPVCNEEFCTSCSC